MRTTTSRHSALMAAIVAGLALPVSAAEQTDIGTADKARLEKVHPSKPNYSPYAGRTFPTMPMFGDTHLHTAFSMDAGAFGARLTPKDAYRFARGEEITSNTGQPVKLSRPLDFLVVADHSDGMGFFPQLMGGDPELLATPQGRKWYDQIRGGKGAEAAIDIIVSFGQGKLPKGFPTAGHLGLPQRLAADHQGGRGLQRARALHRVHRLRVDLEHRRQQPAPQRHLPRQRRTGQPGRALHHAAAAGQRQPGGPVEVDGGHGAEDRQRGARHRAQRQPEQRPHVPDGRGVRQEARQGLRRRRAPSGNRCTRSRRPRAPARRIRSCRPTTSSRTSRSGTRATSTAAWRRPRTCSSSSTRARR